MKSRTVLFAVISLICVFVLSGLAGAAPINIQTGAPMYFTIRPSGPVSVTSGGSIRVTLTVTNVTNIDQTVNSIEAHVIEAYTGSRNFGPKNFPVGQLVPAGGTVILQPIVLGPVTSNNKTLAAIIRLLDSGNIVRGDTVWSFVTTQ